MANSKPSKPTEQERAERRERDREYAQKAVEQLRNSDGWKQWLQTRALFRTYSLGNQLLIAMQHPDAERVAGFGAWLKLGYCVRKGESSIRIWAPCPPTRKQLETWAANGSKPAERPRTFFKLTAVFAQDQVTELPPPAQPADLSSPMHEIEGDDLASTLPRLVALGAELGSKVEFAPIAGTAQGFYETGSRRIVIEAEMSANQQVGTLCHELAHALVRAERESDDPILAYASEELVAESIAFTCSRSLGVNADDKSIPYLASWSEQTEIKVLEQSAALIDRLAKRIEQALHDGEQQASEPA